MNEKKSMDNKKNSDKKSSAADSKNNNGSNKFDHILKTAQKQKNSDNGSLLWTIQALIVCVLLLGIVYFLIETGKSTAFVHIPQIDEFIRKSGLRSTINSLQGNRNILLLGVDSNGKNSDPFIGTRSDTIIILSVDRFGKSVNAISIPRDSKVYIAEGKGIDKINAAHSLGGSNLTIKTIEETFGIDINNYIAINYAGIKDLVREIDGISLNIEKRMYYTDRTAGLYINLSPGYQKLNADQAGGYLRFRHDAVGDIGRIKRQQWFLKALLEKLKSPDTMFKIPGIIKVINKNIRTDMNFFELSNLAKSVKMENIQVATLPGKPSKYGHISYWLLDADKTQKIIDRLIYREEIAENSRDGISVSLRYSFKFKDNIDDIVAKLEKMGYNIRDKSREENNHSQIIAHTGKAAFSKVKALRDKIPELKNSQYILAPEEDDFYTNSDFTIILAE
jgi:LCP family protein required for cell wall assembly